MTEYIVPTTSAQVTRIAAPVIGLDPISPVIADLGTSVIPDFDKITKLPATRRFTTANGFTFSSRASGVSAEAIPEDEEDKSGPLSF